MKLTAIILLAVCLQVSAEGNAQNVTLSLKDAPLEKVFAAIEKQTGYYFTYTRELLQGTKPVNLDVRDVSLKDVLDYCLKNQAITYQIIDKAIIIKQEEQKKLIAEPALPIDVKGRVVNENGEPVIVTVTVKGTSNAVSTDANGYFTLLGVDENATLAISGVAVETREIKVNSKTDQGNIVVKTKVTEGEGVTINAGYYTTTDKKRTGNIAKVVAKEIERQPVTSPLMALQGLVAGLEITPVNGAPGVAPKIRIRGENSLRFDGGYPLYVIDGVQIDSRSLPSNGDLSSGNGFDPLSSISPADIESIEILKDGDATALYGSRGANGVILVTTKKATLKNGNVDVSVYKGVGKIVKRLDLLNRDQYLDIRREVYKNDNIVPTQSNAPDLLLWDITRDTDWQDVLLGETSNITDIRVGISGGSVRTLFRLTGGYHKETAIYSKDFGYKQGSVGFNLNHQSVNKKFLANVNFNYSRNNNNLVSESNFLPAVFLAPNAPSLYNSDGSLNWEINPSNGFHSWVNPLSYLLVTQEAKTSNLIVGGTLSYKIIPDLGLKVAFGFTDLNNSETIKRPIKSEAPINRPFALGIANFFSNSRTSWTIDPQFNYNKTFSNHNLNLIGGISLQENNSTSQSIKGSGYTSDALLNSLAAAPIQQIDFERSSQYRYIGVYLRMQYSYLDKYFANISGRRDGSSRFGPGKQLGNFGSIGAAWIFTKEKVFEKKLSFVSFGKLRFSYAITGNDQIPDYGFYDTYGITSSTYQGGTNLYPTALFNQNFAWEQTKKMEIAMQLGLFKNRINLEASWYRHVSSNQLVGYPLPVITGFPEVLSNLPATIQNTGFEILMSTINLRTKDFRWNTSINLSIPKNKLLKFDGIENTAYATMYKVGEPLSIMRLFSYAGIDPQTGNYKVVDINADGFFNNMDKQFMKPIGPKFYGGLINTFSYKMLELSFTLRFSKGTSYGHLPSGATARGQINLPISLLNHWQKPGDIAEWGKVTSVGSSSGFYSNQIINSDHNIINNSFIRLQTLSLTYNLPTKLISKAKLKDVKLYLQGQNLFTITKYPGFDPETGSSLPPIKMLTIGIQGNF